MSTSFSGAARVAPGARGPDAGTWRTLDTLMLAATLALATGLAEAAFRLGIRFLFDRIVWTSVYSSWMVPLSYLVFFAVLAVPVVVVARWRRVGPGPGLPVFVFTFASVGSLLALILDDRIHWIALVVLSLGVAVHLGRRAGTRGARIRGRVRRAGPVLAAIVLTAWVGTIGWRALSERSALRGLPLARAGASNVILIILDTVRAANTSLHGYARPTTPALERLAGMGVTFDLAVAPAPWTLPTHASLFTGRWVHELHVNWRRPLDETHPTLAEVLRDHGYVTAGFVANNFYTRRGSGLARGFVHYEAMEVTPYEILLNSMPGQWLESLRRGQVIEERYNERKTADDVNTEVLEWLDRRGDHPFFVFLNYFDAHLPYEPPEEFRARFATDSGGRVDEYDASIAYLDDRIGRLVDALERRGDLDNTLLIVTSDHGELLGEHGIFGHTRSLYAKLLHVPFVMTMPGRLPAGRRVAEPVSLRDVAATVFDLLDIAEGELPGMSLVGFIDASGAAAGTSAVLSEDAGGNARSLFVGHMHYIRRGDEEQLYDLRRDPGEERSLVGRPAHAALLTKLRTTLDSLVREPPGGAP